jgi:AraC family transcriptional regulator of adaptative response / DNA-3-methyladenine glycosylase II
MIDDPASCYRALAARDPRFDGLFFVGVRTTGIYCRPVCPARTPRRDSCSFFATAAHAQASGYRACRRCRPELAPGSAPSDASESLVRRALALVDEIATDTTERADEATAEQRWCRALGVGDRHLRRVLKAAIGCSPQYLIRGARLRLATRLLRDTDLSVLDVALASGFGGERQLRAAVRVEFDSTPSALRTSGGRPGSADAKALHLATRAPFDAQSVLRFFAFHTTAGVDEVDAAPDGEVPRISAYRRTLRLGEHDGAPVGWIEVRPTSDDAPSKGDPRPGVELRWSPSLAPALGSVLRATRRAFDLDARPDRIADDLRASDDSVARTVAIERPGLRVPGAFDGFEVAARTILGQQVSVAAATRLAGRFAEAFGRSLQDDEAIGGLVRAFPTAGDVVSQAGNATHLGRVIGVPRARAGSLLALAEAVSEQPSLVEGPLEGGEPAAARERLLAIPGIGPWTAELVLMRCFGWPDAVPAEDLVLQQLCREPTAARLRQRARRWRPWGSYVSCGLWAEALETRGLPGSSAAAAHADAKSARELRARGSRASTALRSAATGA